MFAAGTGRVARFELIPLPELGRPRMVRLYYVAPAPASLMMHYAGSTGCWGVMMAVRKARKASLVFPSVGRLVLKNGLQAVAHENMA